MTTISFGTVLQIVQIVVTFLVGIAGFLIKRELSRLDEKDKENQSSICRVETDLKNKIEKTDNSINALIQCLNDFKEDVGKDYVKKSDYLQNTSEIMKRLDKIYDMLYEMQGRLRVG